MAINLNELSRDDLLALVAKLQAASQRTLSCKVTDHKRDENGNVILKDGKPVGSKGALAVYGLGQFPVTLYRSQWERLIEFIKSGAVEDFIAAHATELSVKSPKAGA